MTHYTPLILFIKRLPLPRSSHQRNLEWLRLYWSAVLSISQFWRFSEGNFAEKFAIKLKEWNSKESPFRPIQSRYAHAKPSSLWWMNIKFAIRFSRSKWYECTLALISQTTEWFVKTASVAPYACCVNHRHNGCVNASRHYACTV